MYRFKTILRGKNEVPPVRSQASGVAIFKKKYRKPNETTSNGCTGRSLYFLLKVRNIKKMTQAHIHLGQPDENGPVVAFLFGLTPFGISVRKGLVTGKLTSQDLVGPLEGKSIQDLIREMKAGNAYVNVHTTDNPDGEIRGQIYKTKW